ncbi:GAF domain-containing protein [Amycolatopsis alkalitolerans]|uniref:GAF domain-containing protein n=1 Tax=Amycolatopsis alkalitolerans TaxID=2547244 RepID=UPI00135779C2|nr:GAF domain-containing protein [Amycolatopsis alkalitolerans]
MEPPGGTGDSVAAAWKRADDERQRAARAAAVAARHEEQITRGPAAMRSFHENMVRLHRVMENRHRAAFEIHAAYARRLEKWRDNWSGDGPPPFMTTVAEISGSPSALVTLVGDHRSEALVAASDQVARTAHDLESTLGEGPARDATAGRSPVAVMDAALDERWPLYGPAMRRLGIRSVAAAPLRTENHCFGALAVFRRRPFTRHEGVPELGAVADALTRSVLLADELPLLADTDRQPVVNQATGSVSVQCACSLTDALALIQAHAFAEGEPIETVAARVMSGQLRFR